MREKDSFIAFNRNKEKVRRVLTEGPCPFRTLKKTASKF